ncbi:MAG TPA: type IV toxin-antitoxin system AbiEi family antitoxin domain-containing protein [Egibacteraceae bacterium]
MLLPADLTDLMVAQHGLVTRKQCLAHGMPAPTIDAMVHRGALERVQRGVYRSPGSAQPPEQRLMAAVLRGGRGARIDGALAGALHGLEGCTLDDPLSIVIPSDREVTGVAFAVHEGPDVLPGEAATLHGIPTVTVARALLDLAVDGISKHWRVAYDSARRLGLIVPAWLERRALANPDHPGAEHVLAFLDGPEAAPETEGERALAALLRYAPVQPEWGVWLLPGIRVDAVYRAARLVLEYDSREWHTLDSDIAEDVARQRQLEEAGWLVVRVTRRMLREDPVGALAMIERLRLEREAIFAA